MSISSAFVLYCVIWWMVFYMVNPLWQRSQQEDGHVVPGTPASAPVDAMVKKKAIIATVIATVLFVLVFMVIQFRWISLEDVSYITPPAAQK